MRSAVAKTNATSTLLGGADAPASRLCVGIDPHPGTLHSWGLPDTAIGVREFASQLVDTCLEHDIRVVKPQVALFERLGVAGMSTLAELIQSARERGARVIADAKRGDIGSTMAGYAEAWLAPGGDFESDGLTVSPYLGTGSLEPAMAAAAEHHKTVFVLAATSNPEADALQSATTSSGVSVAQSVLNDLQQRSQLADAVPALGAVIGATVNLAERGVELGSDWSLPILAPGFGHQGARLADIRDIFGAHSALVIPTVSRSVARDSADGLAGRLERHIEELARVEL